MQKEWYYREVNLSERLWESILRMQSLAFGDRNGLRRRSRVFGCVWWKEQSVQDVVPHTFCHSLEGIMFERLNDGDLRKKIESERERERERKKMRVREREREIENVWEKERKSMREKCRERERRCRQFGLSTWWVLVREKENVLCDYFTIWK